MCWGWVSSDKCTDVGCEIYIYIYIYIERERERERERELGNETGTEYIYIQGVTGGMCETSGECSLCQTIPI